MLSVIYGLAHCATVCLSVNLSHASILSFNISLNWGHRIHMGRYSSQFSISISDRIANNGWLISRVVSVLDSDA